MEKMLQAVLFLCLLMPSQALGGQALERLRVATLQAHLTALGYLEGGIMDGIVGPATRAACKRFAAEYGFGETCADVRRFMIAENARFIAPITDQGLLDAIKSELTRDAYDASSAQLRNVYTDERDIDSIEMGLCGEVSEKTQYGAYVGYRVFLGSAAKIGDEWSVGSLRVDDADLPIGAEICATRFWVGRHK